MRFRLVPRVAAIIPLPEDGTPPASGALLLLFCFVIPEGNFLVFSFPNLRLLFVSLLLLSLLSAIGAATSQPRPKAQVKPPPQPKG